MTVVVPATATGRSTAVDALRERLIRLGGLARPDPLRTGVPLRSGSQSVSPSGNPGASTGADRQSRLLQSLGFAPEPQGCGGTAWVRRVSVDLGPFLERAGATAPVGMRELVDLTYGPARDRPSPDLVATDAAVLDIETLGLRGSGVVAFLVGLGVPWGERLEVDQLLLADPGAEEAMLTALLGRLRSRRLVVTYNGRTFDLPVLRARCVLARLASESLEPALHCDILRPVRRLFRDRLGACTLRQAEISLLGFVRDHDAPGSEAPERYRAWLHRDDVEALQGVVRHNELDLCATLVLAARLADHVAGRLVEPVHPADRYHLAAHLERFDGGLREEAVRLYRVVADGRSAPWDRHAAHRLARRLCREGPSGRPEARAVLRRLVATDPTDLSAARALAILEERSGDVEGALAIAEVTLDVCRRLGLFRLGRMRGAPPAGWAVDWERRRARLTLRVERRASGSGRREAPTVRLPGVA